MQDGNAFLPVALAVGLIGIRVLMDVATPSQGPRGLTGATGATGATGMILPPNTFIVEYISILL